jgi:hypothetical protein
VKLVAIHQPNFFPWLGYFDKIVRSDVFVFLDHVQLPKTGGSWTNRVKLRLAGEPRWVTAPIRRAFHGVAAIRDIELADEKPWREKLLKTLQTSYGRAPHFAETMEFLTPLIQASETRLGAFNMHAVRRLAAHLGIRDDHFVVSSELKVEGEGTDMLINLARATECSAYLCGGGASGYQEDRAFEKAGIKLIYQNFAHPSYPQVGSRDFVAGLSAVDALMNIGRGGVRKLLLAGHGNANSN